LLRVLAEPSSEFDFDSDFRSSLSTLLVIPVIVVPAPLPALTTAAWLAVF
jgi:hypothetical protein